MCNTPADRGVCKKKSILLNDQNEVASETGMKVTYFYTFFFFFSFSEIGIAFYMPWTECPMAVGTKRELA